MDVAFYSASVDMRGDDPALVTDDAIDEFVDSLRPHSGVVAGGGRPS